jgi:alpha-glucosidase
MGNHDQKRIASRHGVQRVDAINMILASLPGASITYNGDEIGMTDVWISWEDTVDPGACNTNPQDYAAASRDPARTPMQWDGTTSAGFSTNPKTWLPVALDYKVNNVKNQLASENSHLKVFKELRALKTTEVLKYGALTTATLNGNNVLVIVRELVGIDTYVTLVNFGGGKEQVDLSFLNRLKAHLACLVVDIKGLRRIGALVSKSFIQLEPYEAFILHNESCTKRSSVLLILVAVFTVIFYYSE